MQMDDLLEPRKSNPDIVNEKQWIIEGFKETKKTPNHKLYFTVIDEHIDFNDLHCKYAYVFKWIAWKKKNATSPCFYK